MTHDEYEERKRRIEEQHRAAIELLEAARRQQLRALDLVWMTTAEGDLELPRLPGELPVSHQVQPPAAVAGSDLPAPAPQPSKSYRRVAWQLLGEVETALASLPEVFDRNHVCQALGYEPDRASLYRTLRQLTDEGVLALQDRGNGKRPAQYRKTGAGGPRTEP